MSFFSPFGHSKNKVKVELDLSNYATKSELKNTAAVGTSQLVKIDDLANKIRGW